MVEVLPEPGGPCKIVTVLLSADCRASFCDSFSLL